MDHIFGKLDIENNPKYQRSLCYDCLFCRLDPLRCVSGGLKKLLDVNNLPQTCKSWKENW